MSKRIRELAEQAGIVFWEMSGDVDWRQANTETLEKFAELIVRECAGIYSKIDNGNQHMGTDNYLEALHKTFRS